MRLGVNLLFLVPGEVGGSETVARESLRALTRIRPDIDLVVYCGPEAVASLSAEPWAGAAKLVPSPVPSRSKPRRLAAELTWLPWRARRDRVDVLHSMGTTNPVAGGPPSVVTVLDVIYHHFPETFPAMARRGLKLVVPLGARHARRVVAISQAGKRDLVETLRLDPMKVDVAHLGFGIGDVQSPTPEPELRSRLGLGERTVLLTVSPALRHKNLDRLLEAFAQLEGDPALVIAGHRGLERDALEAQARRLGVAERVVFTGWVSDADLEGLYGLAAVFVYPTVMEGFGIPVLEAMRRGVPVACSDASSLPEIAGNAAQLFDPSDPQEIAAAVRGLLADEGRRDQLIERGHERAKSFTWDRHARDLLRVYDRALANA